jgi:hypothetical protein
MSEGLTDQDMRDALDRLAQSADGILLYRYLQKTLCAVTTDSMPEGALRRNEGRRSLAAELMGLMAEGIRSAAGSRADSPITFALAGARAVARTRGAGRRVTADTIVSGWSTGTDTEPGTTNGSGES